MSERVIAVTAVWQRPVVTVIFLDNLRRLGIRVYGAGNAEQDPHNKALFDKYPNATWVECESHYLTHKLNAAMKAAKGSADKYLILGSDDLFSKDLLEYYLLLNKDWIS